MVQVTSEKQLRAWRRYKDYLMSIGIQHDLFLEGFNRGQHIKLLCAFAQSVREGRFGVKSPKLLKADSVRSTLDGVAQAYKLADRADPRLDADGFYNDNSGGINQSTQEKNPRSPSPAQC